MSSCETCGAELRVISRVPSTAMAASATMMIAIATTQPQLRLRPGGLGPSPRGGISCGPAAFCAVNTSVGGSLGRLITWVEPASKPEGAVKRRSSG